VVAKAWAGQGGLCDVLYRGFAKLFSACRNGSAGRLSLFLPLGMPYRHLPCHGGSLPGKDILDGLL